ncbi:MAG: Ig-like domain-containing protein [Acidobacteria bacterium]|nr:Ig-like domain-containing protein [Acidobacteriota bacterium]
MVISPRTPVNAGGAASSWSISPALPAGLAFSTASGEISGTPAVATSATIYTVTATNAAGSGHGTLTVAVAAAVVPVTGVSLAPASASVAVDGTLQLAATVEPAGATQKDVRWSSSQASVATVSATGLVRGLSVGAAQIMVTTVDGQKTAVCDVTVKASPAISYPSSPVTATVGSPFSIAPANSGGAAETWSISPALPAGLTFSTATGQISGTPTAVTPTTSHSVTATNGAGQGSCLLSITVNASTPTGPTFTQQPTSQTSMVGGTATFSAAATGDPAPTFQWQTLAPGAASWSNLAGAGAPSYTTGVLAAGDNGRKFRLAATSGGNTVISQEATLTVTAATSGTPVSGTVQGAFTLDHSPYLVQGDLTVPRGSRLTIEAGVEVRFMGHYKLWVLGGLTAVGTAERPILFTAPDHAVGWFGIRIWGGVGPGGALPMDAVEQRIEYCTIEWAVKIPTGSDANQDASYNNSRGALFVDGGGMGVPNSSSLIHINHNLFRNNTTQDKGGAISFSSMGGAAWTMTGNVFEDNTTHQQGGALDLRHCASLHVAGGAFRRNRALNENPHTAGLIGGVLYIFDMTVYLEDVVLDGNQPDDFGIDSMGSYVYVNGVLQVH